MLKPTLRHAFTITLALTTALSFGISAPTLADARLFGAVATKHVYKNDAANTTVTLVAADDAKTTRAMGLLLSVDSSDVIKINCGGSTRAAFFLGARSGLAQTLYPLSLECRARSANLAGTVSVTAGAAAITGVGSSFTQDFAPGDRITINGADAMTIQSVASNTSMTATTNAAASVSGAGYQRGADNLNLVKGVASTSLHASLWYEQER